MSQVKYAIWLYFYLLIFEGALRKWIFPGLSDALLIVRDPLALYILYIAWKNGWMRHNLYIVAMMVVSVVAFFTAILFGHGNLMIAVFGLRITLLHFPLIFIIGKVFKWDDVIRLGKVTLWIALPMVLLIALQFYTPQSSWFNRGVGGIEGAGFSGAMGYFRPPGTFSFTNGNALFWSFEGIFIIYFWITKTQANKILLLLASAALFGAVSFSISRSLVFQLVLSIGFALVALSRKPRYFWKALASIVLVFIVVSVLSNLSIFQTGLNAFQERFTSATETEGKGSVQKGIFDRMILGGMVNAITQTDELSFWGAGLGMGTNAGAKLITGKTVFLISEGEWGRVIGECGLVLGLSMILIRLMLVIQITRDSYKSVAKGNFLPWMLSSFGFIAILQGQWAQPTSLGFAVLTGGLILASMKEKEKRKLQLRENR